MQENHGMDVAQRCFRPFRSQDLEILADIALGDLAEFRERNPDYNDLRHQLFAICLVQSGAKHFVDGKNGVKDIDVWMIFRASATRHSYPPRVRHESDFGDPYFGRHPDDIGYMGRRVDILGRSIRLDHSQAPIDAVRYYLDSGTSITARKLAEKAVVMIWPNEYLGQIAWPCYATNARGYDLAEPRGL